MDLTKILIVIFSLGACLNSAKSQELDDLSKKLANPVSSLISVPIQANYDTGFGLNNQGNIWRINVQPVIPFDFSDDWNLISRTIVPIVDQSGFNDSRLNRSGISDTVQSFFFSPKEPLGKWIVGAGPVLLLPTASNSFLGGEKWGIGPTMVALRQQGPWTWGGLTNHICSFTGDSDRDSINTTFIQPFLAYITPTNTTFSLNTESSYDWRNSQWSIPINLGVNQLIRIGNQPIQVGIGTRYWMENSNVAADGWGLRLSFVMLFPK